MPERPTSRPAPTAAHAHDLRAEQVILLLKEEWRALPESHFPSPAEGELLLARVVTLCILAYHASDRS